jgi:hypothetical protein
MITGVKSFAPLAILSTGLPKTARGLLLYPRILAQCRDGMGGE